MSSLMYPVGPEPPSTYWLRRAILVGGLVLVIVLLAYACSGGSGGGKSGKAKVSVTNTAAPTSTTSASPSATPGRAKCEPAQLTGAVATTQRTLPAGKTVQLSATISNAGAHSCTLTSGASRQIWSIVSGHDKIWTNAGCIKSTAVAKLVIKAHKQYVATIDWNGRRRDPHCAIGQPATPGTYVASASIDGVTATPVVFTLK